MFGAKAEAPGAAALRATDAVLAARPHKDDDALSEATRELAAMREAMLGRRDAGAAIDSESLAHLNAIIAVVMAMHFPIGQPPWDELEKARDWLRALVESEAG